MLDSNKSKNREITYSLSGHLIWFEILFQELYVKGSGGGVSVIVWDQSAS